MNDKKQRIASQQQHNVLCDNFLNPENSRLNQPIANFRGLTTLNHQLDFPITDPVENVFYGHNETSLENQQENSRTGVNTRLEAKDDYRRNLGE